jgi:hypothetical protein
MTASKYKYWQIFRKLDGLAEEIESSQPPVDLWRKFIYCTSLSGSILGSIDHMRPQGMLWSQLNIKAPFVLSVITPSSRKDALCSHLVKK